MEPLKPETKQDILRTNPQVAPRDIEEYERLLAERFTADPDLPRVPEAASAGAARGARLAELYRKLFPAGTQSAEQRVSRAKV